VGLGFGDLFGTRVPGAFQVAEGPQVPGFQAWANFSFPVPQEPSALQIANAYANGAFSVVTGDISAVRQVMRATGLLGADVHLIKKKLP